MTTETETPTASTDPTGTPVLRRLLIGARWVGIVTVIGATVYLAVLAVMWKLHLGELESTQRDLSSQLTDSEEALAAVTSTLEASRQALDDDLTSIIESANDKARAQDNQILYEDIAIVMGDCADEAGILVGYTYDRALYTYGSLKAYENSVRDYCAEVSAALRDLISEEEGEGS